MAYIREAHPDGEAWQSTINRREGVSLPEARSLPERAEHAAVCRRELKIPFEAALDGLDGKVEAAFSAFPSRVFVIDARGTVTFSSALDVETFRPEALEARSRRRSRRPRADQGPGEPAPGPRGAGPAVMIRSWCVVTQRKHRSLRGQVWLLLAAPLQRVQVPSR